MSLKKNFGVILSLILVLSFVLAGCSSSSKSTSSNTGSKDSSAKTSKVASSSPVTLNIFQFKVEFKDQFDALAKDYEKSHKNVKINITTVGGGQDYGVALKSKFASGEGPAIFNVGGPQDVKDYMSKLADLSDTKAASLALPGTLAGVKSNGKVLGLPYDHEGYGLIYNKQIFAKAGIDGSQIKTFADLQKAVKKLDSEKSKLGIKAVFAFPAKETWVTGLHLANTFLAPEFDNDVNKAFNSKTVSFKYGKDFKNMVDLENKYSVQPTVSLDYSQQVEALFSTGKVAIIQQGNWVDTTVQGDNPTIYKNMGLLPIPVDGYKDDVIPEGVPMYWAVNKTLDPAKIKAAKDFLDWMYTSDTGKDYVLNKFKFIPAYSGYDTSKITDPVSKVLYDYAQKNKTMGWVFMGEPSGWGMNTLGVDIQKYVTGHMTWDQVMSDSKKAWAKARSGN